MRWSEYLATLSPTAAQTLINDLTTGYGGLGFMVRQLARNGELAAVAGALDRAERALDRAYRTLALTPERAELDAAPPIALHQAWQVYLLARPQLDGDALLARIQEVVAQARVAGEVVGADGTVDEISGALRAALGQLEGLRQDMAPER